MPGVRMVVKTDWQGLGRLQARLRGMPAEVSKEMARGTMKDAQSITPVDTGRLRASAKVVPVQGGHAVNMGGAGAPYGPIVHSDLSKPVRSGEKQFLRKALMRANRRLEDAAKAARRFF